MFRFTQVMFLVIALSAGLFLQTSNALDRCLETHRDKPCQVIGVAPIRLKCKVGKWFVIKHMYVKSKGKWIHEDRQTTENASSQCKKSRAKNPSGYYECIIKGLGHKALHRIRVDYTCWEIDPDILAGFNNGGEGFDLR